MTRHLKRTDLAARSEIAERLVLRSCNDHNFGLPTRIYGAMALLFASAVAILATAFGDHMALSYAIIGGFLLAFFAVPAILVRVSPPETSRAVDWNRFRKEGIATATGPTGAGEATILALILPVLLVAWAIAVSVIAAVVA